MINDLFYNQIRKYNTSSIEAIKNAMKETLQNIILVGISKSDFFKYCAFYGGTSLRIFRNLPRFSEDLDFTLVENKDDFKFSDYTKYIEIELNSLGLEYKINTKEKNIEISVESIYFNFNLKSLFNISFKEYENQIIDNELLSIKIEIEKKYFDGGITELKLLTYPSFAQIRTFSIETLFASKLIAILNRKWKARVKGRDYYDYLFYISLGTKVNLIFLENGLKKFGYLECNEKLSLERLKKDLIDKFESVDFNSALNDVKKFVDANDQITKSFNKDIFISSVDLIKAF